MFIAIGLPLVFAAGSLFKSGPLFAPMPPDGVGAVLATLGIMLFLGPMEEFGWRGVAQPLLNVISHLSGPVRSLALCGNLALPGLLSGPEHCRRLELYAVLYRQRGAGGDRHAALQQCPR